MAERTQGRGRFGPVVLGGVAAVPIDRTTVLGGLVVARTGLETTRPRGGLHTACAAAMACRVQTARTAQSLCEL